MITLSGGSYGMPHSTKDEEMLRGFSETLSEGVLWETDGIEMEIKIKYLCSIYHWQENTKGKKLVFQVK